MDRQTKEKSSFRKVKITQTLYNNDYNATNIFYFVIYAEMSDWNI